MSKENYLPQYTGTTSLDRLLYLRDTFSDEIPSTTMHSNTPDNRYKVRKNWWSGVFGTLEYGMRVREIHSARQLAAIEEFRNKFHGANNPDFWKNPTTSEDISAANAAIREIVAEVENDPDVHNGGKAIFTWIKK